MGKELGKILGVRKKDAIKILAIETSCDETAVCVLEASGGPPAGGFKIISNLVASQVKVHAPWGGVVPNLAKREHQKNLPILLKKALKQAKLSFKKPKIDFIAVTEGPGLEPALWVGINFAEDLAKKWKKPLLGINHLEGHIFSVLLPASRRQANASRGGPEPKKICFPVLALVVSGGHTELILMKKWLEYRILGQTLDDAAGEAFDKVAKMLGLSYPGGPVIAASAAQFKVSAGSSTSHSIKFPRPMINSKDYNFSFSGLKTAVLYKLKELGIIDDAIKNQVAYEFQRAAIDVLISKTMRAAKEYKAKTIILGGVVAANKALRSQLAKSTASLKNPTDLLMPEMRFTGDNAAMIALVAYFRWIKQKRAAISRALKANGNLKLA